MLIDWTMESQGIEPLVNFSKVTLGYECQRIPLSEVEDRARELVAKYKAFAQRYV